MTPGRTIVDRVSAAAMGDPHLWITLATALSILAAGEEILARMPEPETAFEGGDHERFRLLSAARAAHSWLVGHGADDDLERPGSDSVLGGAFAALAWTAEELERHYEAARGDWQESV